MDETTLEQAWLGGGAAGVLAATAALPGAARVQALRLAVRKLGFGAWKDATLDAMTTVGNAGIAAALAADLADEANVLCYNLAANLCDCWDDGLTRERRHFEQGLAYADRALALRRQLEKTPDKLAMAHWARGKHLLSLGRFPEAAGAFTENVGHLSEAARQGIAGPPEGSFSAAAYLGLAQAAAGESVGWRAYDDATAALAELRDDQGLTTADAKVYLDQLAASRRLLGL